MNPALRQALCDPAASRVPGAVIVASSVRPAQATARALPAPRLGSAALVIEGDYTGHADCEVEVECVDLAGGALATAPRFVGAGNGSLAVSAVAAETFTLTCVDAGWAEERARVSVAGVAIVARAPGVAGNAITITVDRSGLTWTATDVSVLEELAKGTDKSRSPGLDLGQPVMVGDELPANALRIRFGQVDGRIYRTAKRWVGGGWEYVFEPALARKVERGERVFTVSGSYTVTVAQGASTEVYPAVTTAYDLLDALRRTSALLTVEGVVAPDRRPGGMAARELDIRTDAWHEPPTGAGSSHAEAARLLDITLGAGAVTEVVEARCFAASPREHPNARLGRELWEVTGSVSGRVGVFATGERVSHPGGRFAFTIERRFPDGYGAGPRGRFSVVGIDYAARPAGQNPPPICPVALALGPEARDQQITLVYTKRPSGDCACAGMPAPVLVNRPCLTGEENPTDGGDSVSYPAAIAARMAALWQWRREVAEAWTGDYELDHPHYGTLERASLRVVDEAAAMLERTAVAVAASSSALALWDALFNDVKQHTAGLYPDDELYSGTLTAAEDIPAGRWVYIDGASVRLAYAYPIGSGQRKQHVNGYASSAIASGASVAAGSLKPPGWVTGLSGLSPGEYYGIALGATGTLELFDSGFAMAITSTTLKVDENFFLRRSYVTGAIEPARIRAQCDHVLAAAGISPLGKSDASVVSGDGCWRDREDEAYYWAVTGSEGGAYLPAFTNHPYFSARREGDAAIATREFAFQINVKCADKLREGDTIRLSIGDAGWPATYQSGDRIWLPVVGAAPLQLAGGRNANPLQRWSVEGSVSGPLPEFQATESTGSYSHAALAFTMSAGSVRYAAGDRWVVSASRPRVRWRRDGGLWSAPVDVASGPIALGDGLSARFSPGLDPAFVPGDRWAARIAQPNGPGHLARPSPLAWRWVGSGGTLDIDFGAPIEIDAVFVALATLPAGAALTVQLGTSAGGAEVLSPTALAIGREAAGRVWPAPWVARYLRLLVTGAPGGAIGWLWAGRAVRPRWSAETTLRRDYAIARGGGLNARGPLLGRTTSATIAWSEAALEEADAQAVLAAVDAAKAAGDEPLIWVPQPERPEEAVVGRVVDDSIRLEELTTLRASQAEQRRWSLSLELAGLMR